MRTLCLMLVLLTAASLCLAQTASVLTPITATDYRPHSDGAIVGVDFSGRVMAVYLGKAPDEKWHLYSLLKTGGAWQQSVVPMPEVTTPAELTPRGIAAREPAGGFHLIATYPGGKIYYWKWLNGTWSGPELVGSGQSAGATIVLDANNQPLIARSSTRFSVYRKQGNAWQMTTLPTVIYQRTLTSAYSGVRGLPRLFGLYRKVPVLAVLPPAGNPSQVSDWRIIPDSDRTGWTSPLPATTSSDEWALDWPHQLFFAVWPATDSKSLSLGWAPVGATTATAWQTRQIAMPEKRSLRTDGLQLVSNGFGAVALIYSTTGGGEPALHFHWLSGAGPGPALAVVRPGTQTEAGMFTTMPAQSVHAALDRQGTAHVVVQAVKRGEVPANTPRLFYATVTGGGTSTADPDPDGTPGATGGGTTAGGTTGGGATGGGPTGGGTTGGGTSGGGTTGGTTEQGAKPDMTLTVEAVGATLEAGKPRLNLVNADDLALKVIVTNQGAQYYGDLTVKAEIDGAVIQVTVPDTTGHRLPLLDRGASKTLYLPRIQYQSTYQDSTPSPLIYSYPKSITAPVRLYTGLGRKHLKVTVDPAGAIAEADENNNVAEMDYLVYDGRNTLDRRREGSRTIQYGLNDLGFLQAPRLLHNTKLLGSGYVQRPTQLDVLVGNPEFAGFFLGAEVVVYFDGKEFARQTIPQLDRKPNLVMALQGNLRYYGPALKPDASGVMLHFPVDLTNVAEGNHNLKVVIDPQDKFADTVRGNNEAQLTFRVRPPGGTVRVRVTDFSNPTAPIAQALVVLRDMWVGWTDQQGLVTIPDVPAGTYDNRSIHGEREYPTPRYYRGYANAFTVVNKQDLDISMKLERSLTLVGDVKVAGTGALLTDETVSVFIDEPECRLGVAVHNGHYRLEDVPPGPHTVKAAAYGYQTTTTTIQAARSGPNTDECRLDLTLTDGPRATITGTVKEQLTGSTKPLAGAFVWLPGHPRAADTDAQGKYTLERVAAGGGAAVAACAQGHADASAELPALTAGQALTAPDLVLPKIDQKLKTVDFDATTWAICEETAAAGDIPAIQVNTKFGAFKGALGLMYHATVGQPDITADYLLLWIEGGTFIQGGVSSTIGIDSLTGVDLDTLKVGPMKDLLGGMGKVFTVIQGINKLADWLYGDLDPSMMHRNNKVVGTYTTHTGTEYKQDPFIDIPTSTDIPVAVTFQGGGSTIVRVDHIILKDSTGQRKRIIAEWYSPGFAVYKLDQAVNLSSLEVQLEVAVLNERLQSGVLGNTSKNLIQWKPNESNWLRISGYDYPMSYE